MHMNWHLIKRISILLFFISLNIVLGQRFIAESNGRLNPFLRTILQKVGMVTNNEELLQEIGIEENLGPKEIATAELVAQINARRSLDGLAPLTVSPQLSNAAELLLSDLVNDSKKLEEDLDQDALKRALTESGYAFEWVSHNALVGPMSVQAVITAWFSSETQIDAILNPEFTEQGVATRIIEDPELGEVGVIVQLLALPQKQSAAPSSEVSEPKPSAPTKPSTPAKPIASPVPEISDTEVFTALNNYRQVHGVHQLVQHDLLCAYAEKRVKDLVAYGGLDGHAGFRADFENGYPPQLENYPGGAVGENLAHQFCRNMTTGDSFVAQTGTALIEWCFDSSTAGHREAQLNSRYNNVCIRHDKNMFVIIFGE